MQLLPHRELQAETGGRVGGELPGIDSGVAGECRPFALAPGAGGKAAPAATRGAYRAREAALLLFCDPLPDLCSRLQHLSRREWRNLLRWLDFSGLGLYFFDRMVELQIDDWLPDAVAARLLQNKIDNAQRTAGMISESIAIQKLFQENCLSYAVLKGLSLWPDSTPRPELRSQFDLDFLVAESDAVEARRLLESRGYRLYAMSGRSWEFKVNERPGFSLKDLYKDLSSHAVELHLECDLPGCRSLLRHTVRRELFGISMSVLSPADLLLAQGMHAFKHLRGEFTRASHLLEFRRHVLARGDDSAFWKEFRTIGEDTPCAPLGLGVVTMLVTGMMGEFAPEALTSWTVRRLPRFAQLWVEWHGRAVVFDNAPGSKRYLLLQKEVDSSEPAPGGRLRRKLLPLRLPPPVVRAFANESFPLRLKRQCMQLRHILWRLRFHVVEGARFLWHWYRWRQQMDRITQ